MGSALESVGAFHRGGVSCERGGCRLDHQCIYPDGCGPFGSLRKTCRSHLEKKDIYRRIMIFTVCSLGGGFYAFDEVDADRTGHSGDRRGHDIQHEHTGTDQRFPAGKARQSAWIFHCGDIYRIIPGACRRRNIEPESGMALDLSCFLRNGTDLACGGCFRNTEGSSD